MLRQTLFALQFPWIVAGNPVGWRRNLSQETTLWSEGEGTFQKRSEDTLTELVVNDTLRLRFKEPNICELTPGVHSYSGYVDIDEGLHLFFWFFEARTEARTAPITLWLNGGPGSDSLIGLLNGCSPQL